MCSAATWGRDVLRSCMQVVPSYYWTYVFNYRVHSTHCAALETLTVLGKRGVRGFAGGSFVQCGLGQGFVGPLIPRHGMRGYKFCGASH
jgi:hypothetical protein